MEDPFCIEKKKRLEKQKQLVAQQHLTVNQGDNSKNPNHWLKYLLLKQETRV